MAGQSDYHFCTRKKIKATTREPTGAAFMLRCAELGLVADDVLQSFTMGMVNDMLIEKANDREKYPELATQEHYDSF